MLYANGHLGCAKRDTEAERTTKKFLHFVPETMPSFKDPVP